MDGVGSILEIFIRLWDCLAESARTVKDFKTNQQALHTALDQLKDVSHDVKRRVELDEQRHMVRTKQVDGWLDGVEDTDKSVKDVLEKASRMPQASCYLSCLNECSSNDKLSKELEGKLNVVEELKNEGNLFHSVAEEMPRVVTDKQPLENTVGLNSAFKQVQRWIQDSQVKVIGIYGMGGVGKTTLLKKINNSFLTLKYGFDQVIWVVVSRPSSIEKVQNAICDELNLPENKWKNKSEDKKAKKIFKILCKKKFVLMLDDVWERLDLIRVGVPALDDPSMSKVVFTTRSEDVCHYMRSHQKIKLECLAKDEALDLFKKNVGTNTLNVHPNIQKYVGILADECKGLPLAIITVGRAMVGKKNPSDWERAIKKLQKDPSTITGVEDEVFRILKFSYDNLSDDTIRSCFVYCCIYPEDYEIRIDDLLDLWIGEGFLDEFDDTHEARDQGKEIIDGLIAGSLLENGRAEWHVKMHDVIRDMALWISNGSKGKNNGYLVFDNIGLLEAQLGTRIVEAERVSLWNNAVEITAKVQHSWSSTVTLLARSHGERTMFHFGFIEFIPIIKVLDLSNNQLLIELPPSIGKLVELEFLNLYHTRIRELPIELKKLTKLKYLLLDYTPCIVIPWQIISSFSLLRVFRLSNEFEDDAESDNKERHNIKLSGSGLLEELENLPHINNVSIDLFDVTAIEKLMSSRKLLNCLSYLGFTECKGLTVLEISASSTERMRNLRSLHIRGCELQQLIISKCFHKLREVYIEKCKRLLDLTWLIYAPTLERLVVEDCASMVEVIGDDISEVTEVEAANSEMFSRLKRIVLIDVPLLRSVCPRALPFPSLAVIDVRYCPNLRRLPLDSTSAKGNLKKIMGRQSWWDALEWNDESNVGSDNNAVHNILSGGRTNLLEELECLQHVNEVSITLFDLTSVEKLKNSHKILNCLSSLCIEQCGGLTLLEFSSSSVERMRHLQRFDIYYCELQQLIIYYEPSFMAHGCFHNLHNVYISYCNRLSDLTWLIYAPMLELLNVAHCVSMEKIVTEHASHVTGIETDSDMFSRLKRIRLIKVPRLQSVCLGALPLPSLAEIHVRSCHSLKRLPFDSRSGQGCLKEIRGCYGWWASLQWEDETLEPIFREYFVAE